MDFELLSYVLKKWPKLTKIASVKKTKTMNTQTKNIYPMKPIVYSAMFVFAVFLSACSTSTGFGTFNFNDITGCTVTNLFLSKINIAYIPNAKTNTISICPVDPINGSFMSCSLNNDVTLKNPESVWIAFQTPV